MRIGISRRQASSFYFLRSIGQTRGLAPWPVIVCNLDALIPFVLPGLRPNKIMMRVRCPEAVPTLHSTVHHSALPCLFSGYLHSLAHRTARIVLLENVLLFLVLPCASAILF